MERERAGGSVEGVCVCICVTRYNSKKTRTANKMAKSRAFGRCWPPLAFWLDTCACQLAAA